MEKHAYLEKVKTEVDSIPLTVWHSPEECKEFVSHWEPERCSYLLQRVQRAWRDSAWRDNRTREEIMYFYNMRKALWNRQAENTKG